MAKKNIVITDKKYELICNICDSVKEAAEWIGTSPSAVSHAIKREGVIYDTYKVFKVEC